MRRIIYKSCWCLLLIMFISSIMYVKAEAKLHRESDIVFVIDVSGSMKSTDATNEVMDFLKIAVDLCKENDQIALIAYNDVIAYRHNFVRVSDKESIEDFKETLSNIQYSGNTDIGLGLKEAVDILLNEGRKDSDKHIILLSDGEIDLEQANTERTNDESKKDVDTSIQICNERNIKIHTIGFVKSFSDRVDYLSIISDNTDGEMGIATSPFMLLDIIRNIFLNIHEGAKDNIGTFLSDKSEKTIIVPITADQTDEYNIIIYSSGLLKDLNISSNNSGILTIQDNHYAVIKIKEPISEKMSISLKCSPGHNVTLQTMEYYALQEAVSYEGYCDIKNAVEKNNPIKFVFSLKKTSTNERITEKEFYDNLYAKITVSNILDNQETEIQGNSDSQGIVVDYVFRNAGIYNIKVTYWLEGKEYQCFSITEVINIPPKAVANLEDSLCVGKKTYTYNISKLFENSDKDTLSYEIINKTDTSVEANINGAELTLNPIKKGESIFKIKATDSDGESAEAEVRIQSIPVWKYHFKITIGLAILFIIFVAFVIIGIILIIFQKESHNTRKFTGVLTGDFIHLNSKNKIGTMRWNLSQFTVSKLSLEDLFLEANVNENLPDTHNIVFYPKSSNCLEVIHDSINSVFINADNIVKNVPAIIEAGDTIYIGFYENSIELELKFTEQ